MEGGGEEPSRETMALPAAGKAYEFGSPVKDKLDGTAQKAKRVAEDEAEYPYPLFLSPCSLLVPPFSPRLSSPLLMSLFVVSLTTVLVSAKAKEGVP